ncbi:major capsid protein [Streptomyces dubilierae]|uniref:Major capsid protein n=1 Tax=Streptomyces dubilierae TaxID=3075533 RepID=A0ABU2P6P2_9ACTN|nr:major capsid protein [Streptomyces sp. DSM 41921]MDT0387818.1 major capsid protein [Streptomyces sp. DSM 41921]
MAAEELFSAPPDLTLSSDTELAELETRAVAEFERVSGLDSVDPETLQYAMRLTDDLDRIRAELSVREDRARRNAELEQARNADQLAALQARVHGTTPAQATAEQATQVDPEAIAAAAARGVTAGMIALMGERRSGLDPQALARRATASLAETAQHAPKPNVPQQRLAVTASVDIPGVAHGGELATFDSVVDVVSRKAKSMPVTRGNPNYQTVASIRNEFAHTVDDRTTPAQVEELFRFLTSRDGDAEALVAAGGWCAPSEIRYDFFNIACSSGLIDLPTFGVTRGGVQFPVSPSLADAVDGVAFAPFSEELSVTSVPWLWTEADDIAAATGSPTKPCIRVPCPDFDEARLELYGICLTAGNLANDAYPEATQNTIRLLMAAHDHAVNARLIAQMLGLSTSPISLTGGAATDAAAPRIFNAAALAAVDTRERYGMCIDDVLEIVLPQWVREVIRADLAWKAGVELLAVSNGQIDAYFLERNVRPQWVDDWQVRGSGQFGNASAMTAWPTTVDFLMYPAGTFLHGNGMSLDLGVVRDSVLNETNDHTAAWSEEAHLVARVGHESRRYRVGFNVNGSTSALLSGTVRV